MFYSITDMRQQFTFSQTMSCLKFLTSVEGIATPFSLCGDGIYWCTYAENGDKLYLRRLAVSISKFFAHTELPSRSIWVFGPPFPSLLIYIL